MSNIDPSLRVGPRHRRAEIAAIAAGGMLALFGGVDSPKAASAETTKAPDQLSKYTNTQMASMAKTVEFLVKQDIKNTYQQKAAFELTRYVVAVKNTGANTFTQVMVLMRKGQKTPESTAIAFDAPTVKFNLGNVHNEPFDRLKVWMGKKDDPDTFLYSDIYKDATHPGWDNIYWDKEGSALSYKCACWHNGQYMEGRAKVTPDQTRQEINDYLHEASDILSHAGESMSNPINR